MCHYDDQTNIAKQLHAKMKENVRRPADGHAGVAGAQRANTSEDDDDRRRAKGGDGGQAVAIAIADLFLRVPHCE